MYLSYDTEYEESVSSSTSIAPPAAWAGDWPGEVPAVSSTSEERADFGEDIVIVAISSVLKDTSPARRNGDENGGGEESKLTPLGDRHPTRPIEY